MLWLLWYLIFFFLIFFLSTPATLDQNYIVCELQHKINVLYSFLRSHLKKKSIVFFASCKEVWLFYFILFFLFSVPFCVTELNSLQLLSFKDFKGGYIRKFNCEIV